MECVCVLCHSRAALFITLTHYHVEKSDFTFVCPYTVNVCTVQKLKPSGATFRKQSNKFAHSIALPLSLSRSLSLSAIPDFRRVGSIKWWAHGVLRAVRLSFRIDAEIERPIGGVRSWSCSHNAAVWPVKTVVHSLCAE